MSASAFSIDVVIRLLLSTLRSYPSTPDQNASIVSVQAVSSSNLINSEHNFCIHKITTNHLVSGDLPVDTIKSGVSALLLMRQLGVSYCTAWMVKQKLMQVMKEREDTKRLKGLIQLDDVRQ